MPAVIITSVWKSVGFSMVVYLAGLQSIPEDYYDAAKIDGAVGWQRLKDITIPLLSSTTLFLAVVSVLGAFQVFTEIFIMTNGGPLGRTTTIVYHIYQTAFKILRHGLRLGDGLRHVRDDVRLHPRPAPGHARRGGVLSGLSAIGYRASGGGVVDRAIAEDRKFGRARARRSPMSQTDS